ncbi:MAG: grpE [Ilumatobacteraceae bacterium]|nr:grpE [Ilumatobacteraceae bacterium]
MTDQPIDMDGVEAPLTEKQVSGDTAAGINQPSTGFPDDPGAASPLDDDAVDVETDIRALLTERDSYKEIAQRLQADFENFRKRISTQHADDMSRATGKLAEALLPVLDACEAAFVQHPAEIEPLFNLLLGELKRQGLEALDLHEQPFDPAVADAVLHEPGDGEPVVSEVLRTGYTWKGKVLRPAMVKVRG